MNTTTDNEIKKFIMENVTILADLYNVNVNAYIAKRKNNASCKSIGECKRVRVPVENRNSFSGFVTKWEIVDPESYELTFGIPSYVYIFRNGGAKTEYKMVLKKLSVEEKQKIDQQGFTGIMGLICHEFAHVLQSERGPQLYTKNGKRIYHGQDFVNCYKELIRLAM